MNIFFSSLVIVALVFVMSCATPPPVATERPGVVETIPTHPAEPPPIAEVPERPNQETLLNRMSTLLTAGDFDAALAVFDLMEDGAAETLDMRLLKASVLVSSGRSPEARALVGDLAAREPNNPEILYVLAEASAGRDQERKTLLERVVTLDDKHAPALAALGTIAFRNRVYRLAETYYDRSLAADPTNGEALIGKARVRRQERDPKGAEAALNRAIAAYPAWATPLAERARIYREEGFLKHALDDLDRAVALGRDDYWIALDRANVLLSLGRRVEALAEYDRAIALDPDQFLAYVYSAGIRDEEGAYAEAERDYSILARLKPDYYFAHEALGILRMRDGRWALSRDAFLEAYRWAPNNANYALLASLSWMKAEKPVDARPFLARALRTVPRDTVEWHMIRLFHDQSGDTDIVVRVDRETNADTRARMLYYLAQYYALRGNMNLATTFHQRVRSMNRRSILEWRLNEWALEARIPKE